MLNNPNWKPVNSKPKNKKIILFLPPGFKVSKAQKMLEEAQVYAFDIVYTSNPDLAYTWTPLT